MYGLLIVVYVVVCLFLITVILLQAGRGGGLSGMFGAGAQTQTIFGTRTATFLTRATTVFAALFLVLTISLSVLAAQKTRSLMLGVKTAPSEENETQGVAPVAAPEAVKPKKELPLPSEKMQAEIPEPTRGQSPLQESDERRE